jgi:hypothetical protein
MRRCNELGLRNIRFAQADILQLGTLFAIRPLVGRSCSRKHESW